MAPRRATVAPVRAETPGLSEAFGRVIREELAGESGLHRTHIGKIERGATSPSLQNAAQIGKALKVQLSELLARTEVVLRDGRRDPT